MEWVPSAPVEGGLPVTGYAIYVNKHRVLQLAANDAPVEHVCAQVVPNDLQHLKHHARQEMVSLTVRAIAERYESVDSKAVLISKDLWSSLLVSNSNLLEDSRSSSGLSVSEEEREVYSPARREMGGHVTTDRNHVTTDNSHVTIDSTDGDHVISRVINGSTSGLYYRALYSYDPFYNSPNDGGADEELAFKEGDIIKVGWLLF